MIWWTGLAPCEFEFPSPGSLTSAFLASDVAEGHADARIKPDTL